MLDALHTHGKRALARLRRTRAALAAPALALTLLAAPQSGAAALVFAVSEGSSGSGTQVGDAQIAAKYKLLVDAMERSLGDKITVRYVRNFAALEDGMKKGQFDLVLARPSDYPARGVRDHGFTPVVASQPDGHCLLVVRKDSPVQSLAGLQGQAFVLPEEAAYMARFCLAEMRDRKITPARIHHVREQAAIPFALQNNLAQVGGIASYSGVAQRLDKEGLRVLHTSRGQPYLPLIAGPKVGAQQVERLRGELSTLASTEQGAKDLATLGLKGFDAHPAERLQQLLQWLESPAR